MNFPAGLSYQPAWALEVVVPIPDVPAFDANSPDKGIVRLQLNQFKIETGGLFVLVVPDIKFARSFEEGGE
jgi:hypothetical protein